MREPPDFSGRGKQRENAPCCALGGSQGGEGPIGEHLSPKGNKEGKREEAGKGRVKGDEETKLAGQDQERKGRRELAKPQRIL